MTKALVVADLHGSPRLFGNAIRHAQETRGLTKEDRIIVAGDLVDIGQYWQEVIEDVEQVGAEVLWGNHDVAAVVGQLISPQDPTVSGYFLQEKAHEMGWKLAAEHNGVLITHAGLSNQFARNLGLDGRENVPYIAQKLNDVLCEPSALKMLSGMMDSPLWFRPFDDSMTWFPVPQVAGHTPQEYYDPEHLRLMELGQFTLIDMYVRKNFNQPNHAVYAIIDDDGKVERVVT